MKIASMIQDHKLPMHTYLGVLLTCFRYNALKYESDIPLCYFQYFYLEKWKKRKLQYYDFIDQLVLMMDKKNNKI